MKNRFLVALILLIFLSTYNLHDNLGFNFKFKIENIIVENNKILNKDTILKKLEFLYNTNLLQLKNHSIKDELNKIDFIESFIVKRIYPNTIKIKVFESVPVAILQEKKKKFFYTSKGKTINLQNLDQFKELPIVFGDRDSFHIFYQDLLNVGFPTQEIKMLYLFESKRWDIITIKNQTIKLPINNYKKSLKNFLNMKDQFNFDKFKIIDYRINNQLILK